MDQADHAAIVQLTIDYCWALDTGTRDELRLVFVPDAVADLGAGGQRGVEEIIERVSSALGPLDDSQHMVTNQRRIVPMWSAGNRGVFAGRSTD